MTVDGIIALTGGVIIILVLLAVLIGWRKDKPPKPPRKPPWRG
jgi:hypothetical protein